MRIIAKRALVDFIEGLAASEKGAAHVALMSWFADATEARWGNYQDIKGTFNTADWIGNGKVVFDVGGNKYRLVALIGFKSKRVFILFVGSHKDYDKVDVKAL